MGTKVSLKNLDELIAKTKLQNEVKVKKILEDGTLEDAEKEAVMTALRILSAAGLDEGVLSQISSAAGLEMSVQGADDDKKMEELEKQLGDKDEELEEKAGRIEKLSVTLKALQKKTGEVEPDYDFPVTKSGLLDIEKVPANTRKLVQKLWDQDQNMQRVTKALDDERDLRITKEYNEKAGDFECLAIKKEDLGQILKTVAVKAPDAYEKLEGVLKSANTAVKKSGVLEVVGSGASGSMGDNGDMSSITQRAVAVAKESNLQMSEAKAITHFITKTSEGRKAYSEYVSNKRGA